MANVPTTARPRQGLPGQPGVGRVLLLLSSPGDRRMLGDLLSRGYEVLDGEAGWDEPFDACVVDAGSLSRVWERLEDRRKREAVLLPVVLIAPVEAADIATALPVHVVDEVVPTPLDPSRLVQRLQVLLEVRRRDAALLGSRDAAIAALRLERDRLEVSVQDLTREAEHAAREAQRGLEATSLLLDAAAALSRPIDSGDVLRALVDAVKKATARDRVTVMLYHEEQDEAVVATQGFGEAFPPGARIAVDALAPQTRTVIEEGRPQIIDYDDRAMPPLSRQRAEAIGYRLVLVVPLALGSRVLGFFNIDQPGEHRPFTQREVDLAMGIASQAAVALENARLFEAERDRARLERSMADVYADLASSLDIDVTMPGVFEKARAELGAFAAGVVDRIEGGWRIRVLVGEHKVFHPGYVFEDRLAPTLNRMARTRAPEIVSDVHSAGFANLVVAKVAGYRAYAGYPLLVRGEVVGALGVFFREPRYLSEAERDYIRRFGFSVSLAEENSRLYKAEHRIAETLQTALLALPERIPGIEFAHFYASATEAARVGGDFYDLFELEHDMIGVTVGDMSGHGVDAAVLTSLVKNAVRVQATQQDRQPNEVMAAASDLLYRDSPSDIFATVFFGVLHLDSGLLEYCNAGHTTGACICGEDGVRRLAATGPLTGAFSEQEFNVSADRLGVGDLLFLYTDGLTEARRNGEMFGEDRLFELLERERGRSPSDLLRHVVEAVLAFAGGKLSDDLAILVVQRGR